MINNICFASFNLKVLQRERQETIVQWDWESATSQDLTLGLKHCCTLERHPHGHGSDYSTLLSIRHTSNSK